MPSDGMVTGKTAHSVEELLAPLSSSARGAEISAIRLSGGGSSGSLSKAERRELLRKVRANEEVIELEVDILASRDPVTPKPLPYSMRKLANANFTCFYEPQFDAFGRSFKGGQFLRDHSSALANVGGKILSSSAELEKNGSQDEWVIRQTLHVVEPWAVEGILSGSLDRFSIGWGPKERGFEGYRKSLYCTVCAGPFFGGECAHWPGDVVKNESGEKFIAELQWRNVVGREVSGVAFPAVLGTGIDHVEQLAALAQLRGFNDEQIRAVRARFGRDGDVPERGTQTAIPNEGKNNMDPQLCKLLGLSADAAPESVIAAVEKLQADASAATDRAEGAELELKAEREAHDSTRGTLSEYQEREAKAEGEKLDGVIAKLYDEGKLVRSRSKDGKEASDALEASIREMADKLGLAHVEKYAERLSSKVPQGRQAGGEDPSPRSDQVGPFLSDRHRKMVRSTGMSEDAYQKAMQRGGALVSGNEEVH